MFIRKHPGILCTGTFFVELSVPFTVVFHLGIFEQGIDIYMKDDPAGHVSNNILLYYRHASCKKT